MISKSALLLDGGRWPSLFQWAQATPGLAFTMNALWGPAPTQPYGEPWMVQLCGKGVVCGWRGVCGCCGIVRAGVPLSLPSLACFPPFWYPTSAFNLVVELSAGVPGVPVALEPPPL